MAAADNLHNEQFAAWRSQSVQIRGETRSLSEIHGGKWYHASDRDVTGTVEPGHAPNHKESPTDSVSISSDPTYAQAWGKHLYEVEPQGEVTGHRVGLANMGKNINVLEARVKSAKVIRKL